MHHYGSEKIRNVVLTSHSGAGKTSLAEAILLDSRAISRLGSVDDGTTTSDYDPDEIKRKISINLSLLPCQWRESKLNFIDTPGYPDFVAEVKSGLRVSEGAIIVVCAASGVEVGTEQVWEYATESKLPCLIFVNKMDRENANFFDTLEDIRNKLGAKCLPIQLPIGSQKDFQGLVDLVTRKGYVGASLQEVEIPSSLLSKVDSYRDKLIEAVVEIDDQLIAKYLDGEEISEEEIHRGIKQATMLGKVVPILLGSALSNTGITLLLDAIHDYLPSPREKGGLTAINTSTGAEEAVEPVSESSLSALVFKTNIDPYVGKLSYFRVYSGTISGNSQVWNVNKGAIERIGQLFILCGKTQDPVPQLSAGDIGAVAKLASTATGDALSSRDHPLKLIPVEFPQPVLNMAVHPRSKADLDKMSTALPKICEEDLTLKVQREPDIGEMLLCGMGGTHLEVASERLSRKFGVEVNLELPKVPYKETITMPVKAEYKHKKQTGGHGQFGHVFLELEPLPRGSGFEFTEKVVGGAIPKNYIPAVEKGVNEARLEGVLAGYPAVDMRVKLYDGSYHSVDSSDISFKIAGAQALKKGLSQGQPVLLEPVVNLTITVPEVFTGDIIGDLNAKRAHVLGMTPGNGTNVIQTQAPLAEVLRYAIDLRSMTQGRGTFTTEFSHYEEVPAPIAQKIITQRG
ncbi:MAG TPA: elongation factor G [Dehalococcoidia bacterium]|nr:elongation factor G [Dehalococcoidia bacterium]